MDVSLRYFEAVSGGILSTGTQETPTMLLMLTVHVHRIVMLTTLTVITMLMKPKSLTKMPTMLRMQMVTTTHTMLTRTRMLAHDAEDD